MGPIVCLHLAIINAASAWIQLYVYKVYKLNANEQCDFFKSRINRQTNHRTVRWYYLQTRMPTVIEFGAEIFNFGTQWMDFFYYKVHWLASLFHQQTFCFTTSFADQCFYLQASLFEWHLTASCGTSNVSVRWGCSW